LKLFLLDPFARVAFLNYSQATEKVEKTLCPTWDQTLLFDTIEIYGEPKDVAIKPPPIIIELFDHDPFVCCLYYIVVYIVQVTSFVVIWQFNGNSGKDSRNVAAIKFAYGLL